MVNGIKNYGSFDLVENNTEKVASRNSLPNNTCKKHYGNVTMIIGFYN